MSPSATRLAGSVITERFDWQRERGEGAAAPMPEVTAVVPEVVTLKRRASDAKDAPLPPEALEKIRQADHDGYARGRAEGERAGMVKAQAGVEPVTRDLARTIDEIGKLRHVIMHRSERELVRLAVAMAERIVKREVSMNPEVLVTMARAAIDRLGENITATIQLHPTDYDAITAGREMPANSSIELVADPTIPRGGCLVRSPFGVIDAGVDSQMRELMKGLFGDHGEDEAHGAPAGV